MSIINYNLKTNHGVYGIRKSTNQVGGDYIVLTNDNYDIIAVTTGAVVRTVTLPDATSNQERPITVIKVDAGVGTITLATAGMDTIIGLSSLSIPEQNMFITVYAVGTNWVIESSSIVYQ